VNAIAALWGFAEATLFFIVPDVWLTVIAVWSPRKAAMACLFALLGALAGGALMYGWGYMAPGMALTTLERIPGIHPDMLLAGRLLSENMGCSRRSGVRSKGYPTRFTPYRPRRWVSAAERFCWSASPRVCCASPCLP